MCTESNRRPATPPVEPPASKGLDHRLVGDEVPADEAVGHRAAAPPGVIGGLVALAAVRNADLFRASALLRT